MEPMDMDMGKPSDTDYSVREADQYYHRAAGGEAVMSSSSRKEGPPSRAPVSGSLLPRWTQRKGKEKGFEVVRSELSC